MTPATFVVSPREKRRLLSLVSLVAAVLIGAGVLTAESTDNFLAYVAMTAMAIIPTAIWICTGASGIPILPAVAAFHYIYYALPLLRHELVLTFYSPYEIARAGLTATLYLSAGTLTWAPFLLWSKKRTLSLPTGSREAASFRLIVFLGLAAGVIYYLSLFSGLFAGLGSLFGAVRSVMLTATLMGCFMLGHTRARGWLGGTHWVLALTMMGFIVASAVGTLFLITGVIYCTAAVAGLVITKRRIPWKFLAGAAIVIVILHAGKSDIRDRYWLATNSGEEISVTEIPGLLADWINIGVTKLTSGRVYNSAIDRASLIQLLLHVQRLSPDRIPYLNGDSYAQLPNMLVPRFLNPEKQASQYGMNLLNVRYGLQTQEQTQKTAIGWGLLAESFANFGYFGVLVVGLLLGLVSGFFHRLSAGADVISLPTLFAIIVMMQLINLELDATAIISSLAQSLAAVWAFFTFYRAISKRRSRTVRLRLRSIGSPGIAPNTAGA